MIAGKVELYLKKKEENLLAVTKGNKSTLCFTPRRNWYWKKHNI